MISREQILTMIPHSGAMCLLDEVLEWDSTSLRALSCRYRAVDNPMRRADGSLGAATGIEIAAQAMAVHGRLIAATDATPKSGYLAGLREVKLNVPTFDEKGDLIVRVKRLMGDARGASYRFALTVQGMELLTGRATVLLEPGA